MRAKHVNDYNHGKSGWVGGNPRYSGKGFKKGDRPAAVAAHRAAVAAYRAERAAERS